eukprot:TRINITY_DN1518_c0_g1_i2.p1 TRINITY_DN1518_c0_g1~~TRINITY_DN1518_c0_g1_i2.p1  ORF type:complete len:230 (+),score=49.15 TRINITY_DN1518_c0_g1_i2:1023-1712(+)
MILKGIAVSAKKNPSPFSSSFEKIEEQRSSFPDDVWTSIESVLGDGETNSKNLTLDGWDQSTSNERSIPMLDRLYETISKLDINSKGVVHSFQRTYQEDEMSHYSGDDSFSTDQDNSCANLKNVFHNNYHSTNLQLFLTNHDRFRENYQNGFLICQGNSFHQSDFFREDFGKGDNSTVDDFFPTDHDRSGEDSLNFQESNLHSYRWLNFIEEDYRIPKKEDSVLEDEKN